MKKIILKTALLGAVMFWATASFASGTNYRLFIDIFNNGNGDEVTWRSATNFGNLSTPTAANRTAVYSNSSSWEIDFSSFKVFPAFPNPISFVDSLGGFNIVTFTDGGNLTLDVRQASSPDPSSEPTNNVYFPGYEYFDNFTYPDYYEVFLKSSGGSSFNPDAVVPDPETNPVAAVPEPETYALLLAGLAVVGFAAKRRKAK
jgi:hypothetical protein